MLRKKPTPPKNDMIQIFIDIQNLNFYVGVKMVC